MTPLDKAAAVQTVRRSVAAGETVARAARAAGISKATYARWARRFDEAGLDGLDDLPRTGRPPQIVLTALEAAYIRKVYLRSNLKRGAGSMTLAARWAAKDPTSPLRPETRAAILKPRTSKHCLPVEVRRACRASRPEVARYRDAQAGLNDGLYTPGWLRMATDGTRRLRPGERWVGDDATVNVGLTVPWARGGDRCSDRYGVRLGRFQLLLWLDCATDLIPGYSFVMRMNDAYRAADVVSSLYRVSRLAGYAPDECVVEGGPWQAKRTWTFLASAGIGQVSAKGRPNQKLVEGAFNALWTVLSVELPAAGQVGRYRGEMSKEKALWMQCRRGAVDPRQHFPALPEFLAALDRSIAYRNAERRESKEYGAWVPAEAYAAGAAKGHAMPDGLRRYALPVRERRKLRRGGMLAVTAESPLGWPHRYVFAAPEAFAVDGAPVWVSFDPAEIEAGAVVELAETWRERRAGTVLAEAAACISPAPVVQRSARGLWSAGALDARAVAKAAKRASRALVGEQVAAFDERGVRARRGDQDGAETLAIGAAPQQQEAADTFEVPRPADTDWEALERAAGLVAGVA